MVSGRHANNEVKRCRVLEQRTREKHRTIDVVLFDFGGVLAEEGFVNGLRAIAMINGLNPADIVRLGFTCVYETGYVLGHSNEHVFWQLMRERTGIVQDDSSLRREILTRFKLRMWMIEVVKELRLSNVRTGILSDQTNWIDELNEHYDFFKWFDFIFTSYHIGKSKRDVKIFDDVVGRMDTTANRVLFIDDYEDNCKRARERALNSIHYTDSVQFLYDLTVYCPLLDVSLYKIFT